MPHKPAHQQAWAKYLKVPVEQTNSIGMRLVLIPPGEFMMGSAPEQIDVARKMIEDVKIPSALFFGSLREEGPAHRVAITKPYLLGMTEVTIGQFWRFAEAANYVTEAEQFGFGNSDATVANADVKPEQKQLTWRAPGSDIMENLPVTQVTWGDAAHFCNWLSGKDKFERCYRQDGNDGWVLVANSSGYRLPTEAEWEYACRGGTTTQFSFGDNIDGLGQFGWSSENARGRTNPVGLKLPNPFGLYDMHGNVYEWCHDWFAGSFYAVSEQADPVGPSVSGSRVTRGGQFSYSGYLCRSAFRGNKSPTERRYNFGFRVVRVSTATPATAPVGGKRAGAKAPAALPPTGSETSTATAKASSAAAALKAFDADRDGKLDAEERRAMLAAKRGATKKQAPAARGGIAPARAIAPFDAAQARAFQEAWAKYLGVEVEQTNSIGMKLVLIPPGEFLMGRTPKENDAEEARHRRPDGRLARIDIRSSYTSHRVRITKPLAIAATEITIGQFRRFVDASQYKTEPEQAGGARHFDGGYVRDPKYSWRTPGYDNPISDHLPVACVTWRDAVEFCNWLSNSEGLKRCYTPDGSLIPGISGYRLPTEAEWEYTCRAGTTTVFSYGDDAPLTPLSVPTQYRKFAHTGTRNTGPSAVGKLLPNQFGLYDMLGNVSELCGDWFDENYYDMSPGIDPLGPAAGNQRVRRGGTYMDSFGVASAQRSAVAADTDFDFAGFRVIRGSP